MSIKTIGRVLKERRTELGLGLSEAEAFTKIQKLYIVALETDDYKALPGEFYVKAYLKQYSEKLGLNTDKILEAYEEGNGITVEDKDDIQETYRFVKPSDRVEPEEEEGPKDWHYYLPIIALSGAAVAIVAAVMLAVILNNPETPNFTSSDYTYSTSTSKKASSTQSSSSTSASSTSSSSSAAAEKMDVTATGGSMNITLSNVTGAVKVVFTDKTNASVWTLVRNSDMSTAGVTVNGQNPTVTATLTTGATQSTITLGNRSNIGMTINGQEVDLTKFTNTNGPYNIYLTVVAATATTENSSSSSAASTTTASS
ncbi:helix-turn-helix domain-containing protein [Lactococcus sp.]|uniref:helix-turn-helix domain-containing protein n=1 Tax=Lactococcus sp. TaxID=44273 RepID=UPI0035B075A1